jgi:hypothetical protein
MLNPEMVLQLMHLLQLLIFNKLKITIKRYRRRGSGHASEVGYVLGDIDGDE